MTDEGYRTTAVAALADRDYERAGDEFTRDGWATLAEPRPELSPFAVDDNGWVGRGLAALSAAVAAYRVAGLDTRATNRAVEGVAVARDLATDTSHAVQSACFSEFVADFKTLGGLAGAGDAYEAAADEYGDAAENIDSPQAWGTTPLFEAAAATLKQVARGQDNGEIAVTWEDLHGADPAQPGAFLAHRAAFKRQRFPTLVEQAVADGFLAAPRGTTEYDNANHECPNCGSRDVNWVADTTLCLRCSTPTEKR
ncbi:hypothetical protein [Halorientalis litorea]|jgi:hypothetical protein|uniref:hypothetical protein n=1 Tax=Halorientalis litorea TaxID=2931977 RepID=UPI001FF5E63A|nr:hypothetical protein [Halorientalis litorea]